jgi:hypothetical protein
MRNRTILVGRLRSVGICLLQSSVRRISLPMMKLSPHMCAVVLLGAAQLVSGQQAPRPAVPIEPVDAILDAFRSNPIVALTEGDHGNEQGHAFRLSLIRDPRFAAVVNDIVVEFGNARYQDIADQFVRGDAVPDPALRQIWQNTTQPNTVFERPIYEGFLRAVRDVNATLPRERQLRVLLGDPPIDWDDIHTTQELGKWIDAREAHPADLIRREVIAKSRRALVIYGSGHFHRGNVARNYEPEGTIVSLLERAPKVNVFSIWTTERDIDLTPLQADTTSWPRPSLAIVRGTVLGEADFTFYWPYTGTRVVVRDGVRNAIPRDQWRARKMEDQFDAILYLGPSSSITIAQLPSALCADSAYIEMRLRRMALMPGGQGQIDTLKAYCASQTSR